MAGDLRAKERASLVTLSSSQAALSNGSAQAMGVDLDVRAAGNAADDLQGRFELVCQWATITGIIAGTTVAEVYLVPKLDGTNLPDLDLTAGASRLPAGTLACVIEAAKAPTANTNMRFVTQVIDLFPALYTVHLKNQSGQQMASGLSFKYAGAQGQYT